MVLSGETGDIIGEELFLKVATDVVVNIVDVLLVVERDGEEEKSEQLEEDSDGNVD